MASSTWTCESASPLIGCGVDCESVARFEAWAAPDGRPPAFVFSEREIAHARTLPDPAAALCACFGCKEAVLKAIGEPYGYAECELLPDPARSVHDIHLGPALRRRSGATRAIAVVCPEARDRGELIVVAYLFGEETDAPTGTGIPQ